MNLKGIITSAVVGCLSLFVAVDQSQARGFGGGGGARAGGVRSSPSISRPAPRPSAPAARPSAPAARPSTPSFSQPAARPSTPSFSQPAARPSTQPVSRPATQPSTSPSLPYTGVAATRPAMGATQRPSNAGSLVNGGTTTSPGTYNRPSTLPAGGQSGSWTTQGGSEIHYGQGPRGGSGMVVEGAGGGTAGAIRGPGGGTAAGVSGPGGVAAGGYRGPAGGTAGAVRGPAGGGAAYVSGPGGYSAAAVRGPQGAYVAGVQGPHGNQVYTALPPGAVHYPSGGYYYHGYNWYQPYWYHDECHYEWIYPVIGFFYAALPKETPTTTVVYQNVTYYSSDGVYYTETTKDGQKGYAVAEIPPEAKTPDPKQVLKSMTDYLATLPYARLTAEVVAEEVLENGTKVQVVSSRRLTVARPDKFRVEASSGKEDRTYLYDGKRMTVYSREKNVYGTMEMPNTIEATLAKLAKDYNTSAPLAEMFAKDLYPRLAERIKSADYVGLHKAGDVDCHHLAFTQDAIDWEIWIQKGDRPLPRRLTITYKLLPGTPRFTAAMDLWDIRTAPEASAFRFEPPTGAVKAEVTPAMVVPPTPGQ